MSDTLLSSDRTPNTLNFVGFPPAWIVKIVGSDAIDELYSFPHLIVRNPSASIKILSAMQDLMIKMGFDKLYDLKITGKFDCATNMSLTYLMGPSWQVMRYIDIIWELQISVDRGDYYAPRSKVEVTPQGFYSLGEEEKKTGLPKSMFLILAAVAVTVIWFQNRK